MTIREANIKIKQIDNDIDYLERKKEILLTSSIFPHSATYDKDKVDGGISKDKYLEYLEKLENTDKQTLIELDIQLDLLYNLKSNLEQFIDNELHILNKYEPLKRKIIKLRYENNLTYAQIAESIGYSYSERSVRRICKNYDNNRLVKIKEASEYLKNN
nr:MAG TPA: Protein of unknown function (DUF1492) [Caudoviricetes sp.]